MDKKIISILLEDRFGALSRVIEVLGSRGYNLHSICSGESREEGIQRLTLVCFESEKNIQKIIKLLKNIVYVYEAKLIEIGKAVIRELALVKIKLLKENEQKILDDIHKLPSSIRVQNKNFVCFEYLGDGQEIDQMLKHFRAHYKVLEVSRTGEAALDCK